MPIELNNIYLLIAIVVLIISIIGLVCYINYIKKENSKIKNQNERLENRINTLEEKEQEHEREINRIRYNNMVQENTNSKVIYKPSKKIRAIIGDYMPESAEITNKVMKSLGIETTIVPSPEDIFDLLKSKEKYDLIITNNIYKNSDYDGSKIVYEIKNELGVKTPVIVLTVSRDREYHFIYECGFDGYIEKPLEIEKAINSIQNVIKKLEFKKIK